MEIEEANSQLVQAWRLFSRSHPERDLGELAGLKLAWGEVPYFAYNAIIMDGQVASQEEVDRRVGLAQEYMSSRKYRGVLMVCDDWMPAGAKLQLDLAWKMTGMVTEELLPPVRSLPELDMRRVADEKTLLDIYDINCAGYYVAPELGRASTGPVTDWDENTFGYVAYRDDEPVACAATFPVDNRLYVGMVATMPQARRRGYAETVLRHSLEQAARATGLRRTVLHASNEGFPIYLRMGYRETSRFSVYMR
jgi:ribosomal protein S18 acetylase RimI-like enzyme